MDIVRERAIELSERFTLFLTAHPWTHVPVALVTSLLYVVFHFVAWFVIVLFISTEIRAIVLN